jgi:hypothetical protein
MDIPISLSEWIYFIWVTDAMGGGLAASGAFSRRALFLIVGSIATGAYFSQSMWIYLRSDLAFPLYPLYF